MNKNRYIIIKKAIYLASQLYEAIDDNNLSAVKYLLLESDANPNIIIPTKGISSFHLVIGNNDKEFATNVSKLILQCGGNPNVRSDDGLTPVHIAAAWGRIEILQMLLSSGGDPDYIDTNMMTPYDYAVKENYLDCAELLKSFLPIKYDDINKEVNNGCKIQLDKIILDNGYVTGEYEIDTNTNSTNQPNCITDEYVIKNCTLENLGELSVSDNTKLVMNWFNTHVGLNNLHYDIEYDNFISNESSVNESDNEIDQKQKMFNVSYRKSYTKRKNVITKENAPRNITAITNSDMLTSVSKQKEYSAESGIITLPNSNIDNDNNKITETSSDYMTTSNRSMPEKSVFNDLSNNLFTSDESFVENSQFVADNKSDCISSTDLSFITVSEIYKYEDKSEGIVLFQKRTIKIGSESGGSVISGSLTSRMSSLPDNFDYDSDTLRRELTSLGYDSGPITVTTKKVYLKKLYQLKNQTMPIIETEEDSPEKVYSLELERTLKNPSWTSALAFYKDLEAAVIKDFNVPDPEKKWREGDTKSSFTYLLLDPRKTHNLPCMVESMSSEEIWETFLSAIFYVGKGKRSRPYSHFYEAVALWKQKVYNDSTKKTKTILDIWNSGSGVICLHVFHNIIPVEAYTREAAMIAALKLENISNLKEGEYYGIASTWGGKQKRMLGTYLLYKAMTIFLTEGERQLFPNNMDKF